jgi:hypothetical protein
VCVGLNDARLTTPPRNIAEMFTSPTCCQVLSVQVGEMRNSNVDEGFFFSNVGSSLYQIDTVLARQVMIQLSFYFVFFLNSFFLNINFFLFFLIFYPFDRSDNQAAEGEGSSS